MQRVQTSSTSILGSYLLPVDTMPEGPLAGRISKIPGVTQGLVKLGGAPGLQEFLHTEFDYYRTVASAQTQAKLVLSAIQAPSAMKIPSAGKRLIIREATLAEQIIKIQELMLRMKTHLNRTAYDLLKIEGKVGFFDLLPSLGYYYFDQAFEAFEKANPKKDLPEKVLVTFTRRGPIRPSVTTESVEAAPSTTPPESPTAASHSSVAVSNAKEPEKQVTNNDSVTNADNSNGTTESEVAATTSVLTTGEQVDLSTAASSTLATEKPKQKPEEPAVSIAATKSLVVEPNEQITSSTPVAAAKSIQVASQSQPPAKVALASQRKHVEPPPPPKIETAKAGSVQKQQPDPESGKKNPGGTTIHRRSIPTPKTSAS